MSSSIAAAYEMLAERWLDDVFDQTNGIGQHEQVLGFLDPKPGAWALNVGCGCTWPLPRSYRFITAWDSIWHVPLKEQAALMRKLMGALEPGGIFIFSAGGLDEAGEHVDAAMGIPVYYGSLGIPGLLALMPDAAAAVGTSN